MWYVGGRVYLEISDIGSVFFCKVTNLKIKFSIVIFPSNVGAFRQFNVESM